MGKYIDKDKAIALVERCTSKADAITALKMMIPEDVIPLGVEMWAERFDIHARTWRTKDGETEAKSFIITRRERGDA